MDVAEKPGVTRPAVSRSARGGEKIAVGNDLYLENGVKS